MSEVEGGGEAQQQISGFKRLVVVIGAPTAVFSDIARKPSFVAVLLAATLIVTGSSVLLMSRVSNLGDSVRAQLEEQEHMSEADIEMAVEWSEKLAWVNPVLNVVVLPITLAIIGLVFFLGLKIAGTQARVGPTLSATFHAYWPPTLIKSLLAVVLVLVKGEVTVEQLVTLVKSNPAALLPEDSAPALVALLGSIDLFNIWTVGLATLGLAIVGKTSVARALVVVGVPWMLFIVLKVGSAALFG